MYRMIIVQQYRVVIGCFYFKTQGSAILRRPKGNLTYNFGMKGVIIILCALLLLLCGDVEVNPGPRGKKECPGCKKLVTNRQKQCTCGYDLKISIGRPIGTSHAAGFKVSMGRPVGTTVSNGFNVTTGRPVGTTTNAGFNASQGRPVGTTIDAGFNASQGRPVGTTTKAGFSASQGRPVGTTIDAGFNASQGRPIGTTTDNGGGSSNVEDDPSKLAKHIEQFELPTSWNTDECSLSVNENILSCARKYVGKQIRFDSKPLGVAMCYCCGSILWSRADNCHTNLVDICIMKRT